VHTRPNRRLRAAADAVCPTARREYACGVTTRSRVRCYAPLVTAGVCLTIAQSASPVVAYALTIAAFVLVFEGGLSLYERAGGRTGGIKDFRQ
jgi:hypothetical protein